MPNGTVTNYFEDRGFDFIAPDGGDEQSSFMLAIL
jgi:cold shock CspA family protein